jgi:NCS1 family nucleobase:cation symporter-1
VSLALLVWVYVKTGSWSAVLGTPSRLHTRAEFFAVFVPALTGTVGHWAAVALNISDFTRYARSQEDQLRGQTISLPLAMTVYSFIAIAVTAATIRIFGHAIWDPVIVLAHLGAPWEVALAMVALLLATLNVNVAANLVAPANDFSNLAPRYIGYRTGAIITCFVGLALQPWKLLASHGNFIVGWLGGYSSLLGPVAGILITDYFYIRATGLDLDALYSESPGPYTYLRGFNMSAIVALLLGVACAVTGWCVAPWDAQDGAHPLLHLVHLSSNFAWFIGFFVSSFAYGFLMRRQGESTR